MEVNGNTRYWVCDAATKKRYPVSNLKSAKKLRTKCRMKSDVFLETATNVIILDNLNVVVAQGNKLYVVDNNWAEFEIAEWKE